MRFSGTVLLISTVPAIHGTTTKNTPSTSQAFQFLPSAYFVCTLSAVDQGSNFTFELLAELYRLLHIHPIRTSPYYPQMDGLVVCFYQTLKAMLQKTATTEEKDWDKLLPYVLSPYRKVPPGSTGFSPFELLYGWNVQGRLDMLRRDMESKAMK